MLLLDTHALLWFLDDSPLLSAAAAEMISMDRDVAVKSSIGKIRIHKTMREMADECRRNTIAIVPILPAHLDMIKTLPNIHRDPFDRLIVSTAIYEDMSIVTRDEHIVKYPVRIVW